MGVTSSGGITDVTSSGLTVVWKSHSCNKWKLWCGLGTRVTLGNCDVDEALW